MPRRTHAARVHAVDHLCRKALLERLVVVKLLEADRALGVGAVGALRLDRARVHLRREVGRGREFMRVRW
jgi:hypothetical protein